MADTATCPRGFAGQAEQQQSPVVMSRGISSTENKSRGASWCFAFTQHSKTRFSNTSYIFF